ncbi:MAG: tyrosine-type recombinase/integrase [Acidobacteria bacterium]|jgi:site-specific recombinase XerD|nr:tyrosine-type recombinase/integrase [Acidobacteriota bacterium]
MTPIAPHITAFLRERLPLERGASLHTCDTYAYAFKLLFEFASQRLGLRPSALQVEQLDAPLVMAFLEHLQEHRGNSARTRNVRMAAIKSFMRYMEYRVPSALDQIRRILATPAKRTDGRIIQHLSTEEQKALLDAPNPQTRSGTRDRAMCHLAIAGGLRVSELIGLRLEDVTFRGRYADVLVRGKGRKQRILPLWKEVGDSLRAWVAVRGNPRVPEFFLNARGEALTRSGVAYLLHTHAAAATTRCPSLGGKPVSPHVLRHSCGINVLRSTRDIRKVALWLGHERTETSEIYVDGDPSEKLELLKAVVPPTLRPGKFRPPDALIAALRAP